MTNHKPDNPGSGALIVFLAVAMLVVASFVPWDRLTGGRIKGYSLWSDLIEMKSAETDYPASDAAPIDPALAKLMADEEEASEPTEPSDETEVKVDDSEVVDEQEQLFVSQRDASGVVPIEDYTLDGNGLQRLAEAIASFGPARIAVVGDSYIEGDIFTQDLRALLQSEFGGSGVGYMGLHTEFPGFRRSVRQSGSGWQVREMGKKGAKKAWEGLSEHYYSSTLGATATYKGTNKLANVDKWDISRLLLIAPQGGTITITTDAGSEEFELDSLDEEVQMIELVGSTPQASFATSSSSSIVALGVWLEAENGIGVDCMSSRGFSGLTLSEIDPELCHRMAEYIDYQLIVIEFGMNAMSPGQKDFSIYRRAMVKVIGHLRQCYPNAEFLIMGIGDRGEKRGSDVHSMHTVPYMIDAQRLAAAQAHCMFWDTREAMGGEDAIVDWTRKGLTNKDYIHLTHRGGQRLAEEFFNALMQKLR